jgi:hypothetical protein
MKQSSKRLGLVLGAIACLLSSGTSPASGQTKDQALRPGRRVVDLKARMVLFEGQLLCRGQAGPVCCAAPDQPDTQGWDDLPGNWR